MALVRGTNCGFVTVAPVADPATGDTITVDNVSWAFKDASPGGGTVKVTEIGWWCNGGTEAANFEVGIYKHDSTNNKPNAVQGSLSKVNAKGTSGDVWKRVTGLNITILKDTTYWIGMQLDNTATTTTSDEQTAGHETGGTQRKDAQTELTDPWGNSNLDRDKMMAFYALVVVTPPTTKISGSIVSSDRKAPEPKYNPVILRPSEDKFAEEMLRIHNGEEFDF